MRGTVSSRSHHTVILSAVNVRTLSLGKMRGAEWVNASFPRRSGAIILSYVRQVQQNGIAPAFVEICSAGITG